MTNYLSTELGQTANQQTAPVGYRPTATVYQARLKRLRATFTLAQQADGSTLEVGVLPAGSTFAFGVLTCTKTLGATATLAIGKTGATGKYRAAAVSTAVETPALFGITTAMDDVPLAADETVIVTVASAALPDGGTLIVDMFYSCPN